MFIVKTKTKMLLKLLFLIVITFIDTISCRYPEGRVLDGSWADIRTYPFMASIRNKHGSHMCGATIIDSYWILSAAHCVKNLKANQINVQYGTAVISPEGQNIANVSRIITHENFNKPKSMDNDIVLLKLERAIYFNNENIAPVKLPKANFEIPQNNESATGHLVGWGFTKHKGKIQSNLIEAQVKIYSDDECCVRYGNVSNDKICGGVDDGTRGQCTGDSGGPLVDTNNTLLGILSISWKPCGRIAAPGLSTKVSHYISWIQQHVEIWMEFYS